MDEQLIVIKLGGSAAAQMPESFFHQLAKWRSNGIQVLLVHGGGPQINAWCDRMHLAVTKRGGIRVTDNDTMAVTQAVLLGIVQPAICQQLSQHGIPVLGLNTADNHLLGGELLNQQLYGQVGRVTNVNRNALRQHLTTHVGVLAPMAQTAAGQILNVNADMAAAAVAQALHADRLMLITDVPGVLVDGTTTPQLNQEMAKKLVATKVITNGMQAKINAAFACVHGGTVVNITNDVTHPGTAVVSTAAVL